MLVMVSGVVGSNTRRTLDPDEFRGFALADKLAPLVFINGADTKAAQMFTLAHELAHLWLGESALSNVGADSSPVHNVETWCNGVAAELLVPLPELRRELGHGDPLESVAALARTFKVSTLVILHRILDAGRISRERFQRAYAAEVVRLTEHTRWGRRLLFDAARGLSRRFARGSSPARWRDRRCFAMLSTCWGSARKRPSANLAGPWRCCPDAVPPFTTWWLTLWPTNAPSSRTKRRAMA